MLGRLDSLETLHDFGVRSVVSTALRLQIGFYFGRDRLVVLGILRGTSHTFRYKGLGGLSLNIGLGHHPNIDLLGSRPLQKLVTLNFKLKVEVFYLL